MLPGLEVRVLGLEFGAQGFEFRVPGLEFKVEVIPGTVWWKGVCSRVEIFFEGDICS